MSGVNNGWAVATSLLGYEGGASVATNWIRFNGELNRLIRMVNERGVADRPVIHTQLAWCYRKVQIMRYLGMRTLTLFLAGHQPGPDAAIAELFYSEYHSKSTQLAMSILGADELAPVVRKPRTSFGTDDACALNSSASWVDTFLNTRAATIYAGSSEIQRNVLSEMVLGKPKEPRSA